MPGSPLLGKGSLSKAQVQIILWDLTPIRICPHGNFHPSGITGGLSCMDKWTGGREDKDSFATSDSSQEPAHFPHQRQHKLSP